MADKYDHKKIEEKWRKKWEKSKLYKTEDPSAHSGPPKPKFFVLDMFPYPSGEGLHVGHPKGYIATDIYSRWKCMSGFSILHPMGWDAFGLPAENYAIQNKVHPKVAVEKNIARYKEQLSILGFNYDWEREINTSNPAFYKWTQWIFLKLFEKGLAYESWEPINWCPFDKTGLANEDVENGRCERCGTLVEKKPMRQWVLRITDYAEKLLEGLAELDWPTSIKESQKNWIGKSQGTLLKFKIQNSKSKIESQNEKVKEIEVFTTRADTLFGVTYLVLAPEHSLIENLKIQITNWEEVVRYIVQTKEKNEIERTDEKKEKHGVELKGIQAVNPANGEEIPVWIADYVLASYGTGAVMAVPAHDQRDFEFARKYNLPVRVSVVPYFTADENSKDRVREDKKTIKRKTAYALLLNSKKNEFLCLNWEKYGWHSGIIGGVEEGENFTDAAKREIQEETGYKNIKYVKELGGEQHNLFFAAHKDENRYAIGRGMLFELENEEKNAVSPEHTKNHSSVWIKEKDMGDWLNLSAFRYMWKSYNFGTDCFIEDGIVIDSDTFNGMDSKSARVEITKKFGKSKTAYKLKDWVFSRQRYWGEPIPIIHCEHCKKQRQKVLIIHGFEGDPNEGWKPWLKGELTQEGFDVVVPKLPNTHHPNFKEIFGFLEKEVKDFGEDDVIIGHSMGAHFALKLAEKKKLKKIILVAPAYGGQNLPYDNWNSLYPESDNKALEETLKSSLVDFSKMRGSDRVAIFGTDDPDIPIETASGLDGMWKIMKLDGVGHMAHLKEFSELFKLVLEAKNTGVVPVPEKDLPVELPKVDHYEPTDTGESPLANIAKWVNVKCPKCGGKARRETNTMPQWAGSSWYYLRYEDPKNNKALVDDKKEKYWSPVDFYVGGAEHATRHLIYARFWHKFLFDMGVVHYPEPFMKLQNVGLIGGADGRKMSKRFGNVVNPDEMVELYGADTFRLYEMFMGPFSDAIPWSTEGMIGPRRFLEKVWRLQEKVKDSSSLKTKDYRLQTLLHQTIKKVGEDIENFKFNTAISTLMIFINSMEKEESISKEDYSIFLILLAPFAPHITEEIWMNLGNFDSIHSASWPLFDEKNLVEVSKKIIIQIDGKVRGNITVGSSVAEDEIKKLALEEKSTGRWTEGKKIKKVIVVKDRIVSIVTE